jgi:hypothetical protein
MLGGKSSSRYSSPIGTWSPTSSPMLSTAPLSTCSRTTSLTSGTADSHLQRQPSRLRRKPKMRD